MKRIVLAIMTLGLMTIGGNASAQGKYGADSAECIKYLSYYKEYFKQKSYDEALPNWRKAYTLCPATANQTMLIDGTTLMRRLITKNAKNPIYKQALVDTLLTLHDTRAKFYPKYASQALNNKGLDLANYVKNDPQFLYDKYNEIIEVNAENTKSTIFLFDLNAAIELYKNGVLGAEDVINCYQNNTAMLEKVVANTEAEKTQNAKVKTDLESLFISSKVADCDKLIELFTPRYDAAPEDLTLVTNIVKMMSSTEDCMDNDLYLNAVTSMHKLDPSYNSAYFLYKLNSSRGNIDEAIKYLEQAIAYPESDAKIDAGYSYELAAYCFKSNKSVKAYECAQNAISLDAETYAGKAYFLMGQIWGSTVCGGDEIARRAPYWVAVDFLNKAKAADETLAEEANRLIASYAKYYPQTAEAFMYDVTDGQSYTVACGGLKAVTTVRTQK